MGCHCRFLPITTTQTFCLTQCPRNNTMTPEKPKVKCIMHDYKPPADRYKEKCLAENVNFPCKIKIMLHDISHHHYEKCEKMYKKLIFLLLGSINWGKWEIENQMVQLKLRWFKLVITWVKQSCLPSWLALKASNRKRS